LSEEELELVDEVEVDEVVVVVVLGAVEAVVVFGVVVALGVLVDWDEVVGA
jgi:hypothetical protein